MTEQEKNRIIAKEVMGFRVEGEFYYSKKGKSIGLTSNLNICSNTVMALDALKESDYEFNIASSDQGYRITLYTANGEATATNDRLSSAIADALIFAVKINNP